MLDPDQYKPTSTMKGIWLFFVSRRRYVDAAIEHAKWLELQAEDQRANFLKSKLDLFFEETRARESQRFESLRLQLWSSFKQMTLVALLALSLGVWLDTLDPELPLHLGRLMGFFGTFLIVWAALFELGGPRQASWDGKTLSEVIHPRIFQILLFMGTFGLLCTHLL